MIFVILGTQKFQFNRLLQMLDELVEKEIITSPICAQIGYSTYLPKHYEYQQFYSEEEFQKKIGESEYVISHGGLGSMMTSMDLHKKMIVVPRSMAYGEHVDDHQYQLATLFEGRGHVLMAENMQQMVEACRKIESFSPVPYKHAPNYIAQSIIGYIEGKEVEQKEKVLMIGSDLSVKGGIVSVIRNYLNCDFFDFADVIFVPTHVEGSKVRKILCFLNGLRSIRKVIRQQKVRLLHIHVSERGSFVRKAIVLRMAKKRGCKVILHHHGAELEKDYLQSSARKQKFIADTLEEADLNIVLSKTLVPQLKKMSLNAAVKVLYNSVKSCEENRYNPQAREFLMLGRLEQRKGVFELLETIQEIDQELPEDIVFNLCGDGDLNKVHQKIKSLGIEHRIKHVGWIGSKQKETIFKNTMCNILFSHNEGLPMAILETMGHGIVNIATPVASIPEVVIHDETGILVPVADKKSLGEAILKVAKDEVYRMELSERAHQLILSEFDLKKNVNTLEDYYKEILLN